MKINKKEDSSSEKYLRQNNSYFSKKLILPNAIISYHKKTLINLVNSIIQDIEHSNKVHSERVDFFKWQSKQFFKYKSKFYKFFNYKEYDIFHNAIQSYLTSRSIVQANESNISSLKIYISYLENSNGDFIFLTIEQVEQIDALKEALESYAEATRTLEDSFSNLRNTSYSSKIDKENI